MPQVPVLRPREVVRAFERCGWRVGRQRGSHIILNKPGSFAALVIPNHDVVARGTLRSLITKAGPSVEQFLADFLYFCRPIASRGCSARTPACSVDTPVDAFSGLRNSWNCPKCSEVATRPKSSGAPA